MAMVARCRVEVSAGTVRVSTGKYRCSMGLAEWRGAVSASMRGPVALPPGRGRGRVALANGLVVRAHGSDGAGEVWRASLERARPPLPPPPPRGRDRLGAMAPLLERVAEAVLNEQSTESGCSFVHFGDLDFAGLTHYIQLRNRLGDAITFWSPQDIGVDLFKHLGNRVLFKRQMSSAKYSMKIYAGDSGAMKMRYISSG